MSTPLLASAERRRNELIHEMHSPPAAMAALSDVRRRAFLVRRFRALEADAGDHVTCALAGADGTDHIISLASLPSLDGADILRKMSILVLELADPGAEQGTIAQARFRLAASVLADLALAADGAAALPVELRQGLPVEPEGGEK